MGIIYVLHFSQAYKHARHYIGFTDRSDVTKRVEEHLNGGSKASPLVRAAMAAGIDVTLVTSFPGTRTEERRLKNNKNGCMVCPLCRAEYNKRKASQSRARRARKKDDRRFSNVSSSHGASPLPPCGGISEHAAE